MGAPITGRPYRFTNSSQAERRSLIWAGLGLLSYAIGSIPTAYVFTRFLLGQDIRQMGDFNSGAANVFRNVGAKAGLAVGAIDIIKGGLVIVLAKLLVDDTGMEMMAGGAVLVGHIFPVHLRFRGGRGAATAATWASGAPHATATARTAASATAMLIGVRLGLIKSATPTR